MRQLLLLACLLCWSCCVSAKEIIISEKGNDTQSCLKEHNPLVSCQSLVDVSKHVTHKSTSNHQDQCQGVANFREHNYYCNSLTHIYCNSSNTSGAGIVFDRSSDITLENFVISNCGATIYNNEKLTNLTGNGTAIQIVGCSQVNVLGIVGKVTPQLLMTKFSRVISEERSKTIPAPEVFELLQNTFPSNSYVLYSTEIGYSLKSVVSVIDPDGYIVELVTSHMFRDIDQRLTGDQWVVFLETRLCVIPFLRDDDLFSRDTAAPAEKTS